MPGDMAMQEPGAGVVFLECDGEETISGKGGDVSAGWVGQVEGCGCEVECSDFLGEDPEVVAVEMNRVIETAM